MLQRPFTRIGNGEVYVSYPQQKDVVKAGRVPRVVLLCGWMNAQLPHLHRFTEMYHQIYPSATQILVRAVLKTMFVELPANKAFVQPVVKLLHEADINAYDPPESSGLLVHALSNGGGLTLTYLAHALADTRPTPSPNASALPAQAIIYDSVPSTANFKTFFSFCLAVVPPSLRTVVKPLLVPAYVGTTVYKHTIDRRPDMLEVLRQGISDNRLIPQGVPQVFIYGDKDALTPPDSVESYITESKQRLDREGLDGSRLITAEKYIGSSHVSHAKNDLKRYWEAVMRAWEASCRNGGGYSDGRMQARL